jgi:biopolymer transport protein ExbD
MATASTIGEPAENPLPINVTAMVDIIFCLSLFFMCSFHFRQLESKLDSWLPRDKGILSTPTPALRQEELRITLGLEEGSERLVRRVGAREVASDAQLRSTLRTLAGDFRRAGAGTVPVVVDSQPLVPWREVVNVLSLCRLEKLEKLELR